MKKLHWKIIFGCLLILWMLLIFYFSAQTGVNSANFSGKITRFFINVFVRNYNELDLESQKNIYSDISYLVRKLAHFSEFAILSLLSFLTAKTFLSKERLAYILAFIISLFYAISDEFHQTFVADRTPMVKDVIIDCLGAIMMLLLIAVILNLVKLRRSRKKYD